MPPLYHILFILSSVIYITLELIFEKKEKRIFDLKPYLNTGLFKTLRDENVFKLVKIAYDSIEWPNGIDLDPEILYEKSKILIRDNI